MEDQDKIEITPEMIKAGVAAAWGDPHPPAIIARQVEKIYRAMAAAKGAGDDA